MLQNVPLSGYSLGQLRLAYPWTELAFSDPMLLDRRKLTWARQHVLILPRLICLLQSSNQLLILVLKLVCVGLLDPVYRQTFY